MTFARIIALGEELERKNHGQRLTLLLKHLHKTTRIQNTTHQAQ